MYKSNVISINNLSKKFKNFALDIPSLDIPKGFATALIGENGAGKSTFINILAGIRLDYKGTIDYFNGEKREKVIRESIGYTGPGNYFMPHWTIAQIADASELLFEKFNKDKFYEICQSLGIQVSGIKKQNKGFNKLSDGMKMKVVLANVFARETKMLLLDEPASPLDPLMRDKLCQMIREYIEQGNGGNSVLFSTHNITDMENVTDYAIIMEKGKVAEQGFVEDLKEKYILVKGDNEDADKAEKILFSFQKSNYGFEGMCLAENIDKLAGLNISREVPELSQISIAVMKKYTQLI
ncbi:MAG: ABC transporter ATP-binding protein [Lachnospiraceae bacterium]|nr:ABC transporter ATP-binding protein [Lachnospiraceae bacterium]